MTKASEFHAIIPVIRARLKSALRSLEDFESSVEVEPDAQALGAAVKSSAVAGLGLRQLSFLIISDEDVPHVRQNNVILNFEG